VTPRSSKRASLTHQCRLDEALGIAATEERPSMNTVKSLPAVLSFLLLGAHFMRSGTYVLLALCLLGAAALFVNRRVVRWVLQAALGAGVVVWALTTVELVSWRVAVHQPWHRMAVILGGVAAFTAFAAWLLGTRQGER
jgi:hypothetical protein